MAVTQEDKTTKVAIRVNTGTQGSPVYANRSFSNVNPELSDNTAYSVFSALGDFQEYTVSRITRTNSYTMENDE